jgi:protein O-GlcNAc transferase
LPVTQIQLTRCDKLTVPTSLFLDTVPVNANATASDALWAELPLLACMGNTFAGRVGASLLHAIGSPELVASSLAEY